MTSCLGEEEDSPPPLFLRRRRRLADPLGAPALMKRAIYDKDKDVRVATVEALKEIGSSSTVHAVSSDPSWQSGFESQNRI